MTSQTTERFRKAFRKLPFPIQQRAKKAFQLWKQDPWSGSLHFKQIHASQPVYSVRIGTGWRAVGVKQEDQIVWFWIGSHAEYDKLISQL